jgi:UDP-N-acetylmuramoyl-L-alanyl-D-glutamate--2,6-diaminopimelate ligase
MLGNEPQEVLRVMSELTPVNGRFETIRSPKGVSAIIDYAHTPDALQNVLTSIRDIVKNKVQVITVCGAGGNRDKGKRPLMAKEAALHSDRVIITSDNPRFEEPEAIINDMLEGLDSEQRTRTIAITDRREAIRAAVMMAQAGDVILIAGKGHEPYQDIKGVKHHFDDHEEVRNAFGL